MTKLFALVLLAGVAVSVRAEVCVSTEAYAIKIDTSTYFLEASTKTLKADILAKLYQAMEERDRNRALWHSVLGQYFVLQEENGRLKIENTTLWKVLTSTGLCN